MFYKFNGKEVHNVTEVIGGIPKELKDGIDSFLSKDSEEVAIFKDTVSKLLFMLGIDDGVLSKPFVVKNGEIVYIHYYSSFTGCSAVFEYIDGVSFRLCMGENVNMCDNLCLDKLVSYYYDKESCKNIKSFYDLDKSIQMGYIISTVIDTDTDITNMDYMLIA